MKKILCGIFTAAFIAAITFTSCSSPANGSNSSNDNQFSFDDFEPAALPQFQGVNPLAGKTFTGDATLIFTNNTLSIPDGSDITTFDYTIDSANNLIYIRYNKSYILSTIKPQLEQLYHQLSTQAEKECYNEITINYWIKSYYSKFSCYKYTLQDNNLTLVNAYSNQTDEFKRFTGNYSQILISLNENNINIDDFNGNSYWLKLSNLNGSFSNSNYYKETQTSAFKEQGTYAGTISITTAQDPTQSECTITFTQLPSEIPGSNSLLNTQLTLTPLDGKILPGTYTLQQ